MANIQEKIDALCYILFVLLIVVLFSTFNDPDMVKIYPYQGERVCVIIVVSMVLYIGLRLVCYIGLRMITKFIKSICILFG
jgi:hypothetical protein